MVLGDTDGWVYIYDISNTGLKNDIESTRDYRSLTQLVRKFRAHAAVITDLVLVKDTYIVTSSADCSSRCFTWQGEYIGMFGQKNNWRTDDYRTFAEPPEDIKVIIPVAEEESTKLNSVLPSIVQKQTKSAGIRGSQTDDNIENLLLKSWFAKSIYAREKFLSKKATKSIVTKIGHHVYHDLAPISNTLPPLNK